MLIFGALSCGHAQPTHGKTTDNAKFDNELNRLLSFTVPVMSVEELKNKLGEVTVLDAREREEYEVSHIPGATYIGYKKIDETVLDSIEKDSPIVLYCSVGYRSEKIGEKLKKKGFTNVYNLYGSIFAWGNKGYPLLNGDGETTHKIHTYNKKWSQWVDNPEIEKVW